MKIDHSAISAWKSCGAANKVGKLALQVQCTALHTKTGGQSLKKKLSMSKWKGTIGFGEQKKKRDTDVF